MADDIPPPASQTPTNVTPPPPPPPHLSADQVRDTIDDEKPKSSSEGSSLSDANAAAATAAEDLDESVIDKSADGTGEQVLTRNKERQILPDERDVLLHRTKKQPNQTTRHSQTLPNDQTTSYSQSTSTKPTLASSNKDSNRVPRTTNPLASSSALLNYFEIREEIDSEGNELRAEAINVSQQLRMVELAASKNRGGNIPSRSPLHHPIPTTTTNSAIDNDTYDNQEEEKAQATTPLNQPTDLHHEKQSIVSEEAYAKLSARLNELARLEEQHELEEGKASRARISNKANNSKFASSGWSKGFLNRSNNNKKKKNSSSAIPPSKTEDATQPSKATGVTVVPNDSSSSSAENAVPSLSMTTNPTTATGRRVAFGTNQVKGIPRIGERNVSEIRANRPAPPAAAISNVIRERSKGSSDNDAVPPVSPPATTTATEQPKRRLSRFAQERQQMR